MKNCIFQKVLTYSENCTTILLQSNENSSLYELTIFEDHVKYLLKEIKDDSTVLKIYIDEVNQFEINFWKEDYENLDFITRALTRRNM